MIVILQLAARRLDPVGKIAIYEEQWLPELICILRGAEARPISRLIIGVVSWPGWAPADRAAMILAELAWGPPGPQARQPHRHQPGVGETTVTRHR